MYSVVFSEVLGVHSVVCSEVLGEYSVVCSEVLGGTVWPLVRSLECTV